MEDRSRLEKDIERHELIRRPFTALILFVLLLAGFGLLSLYTIQLRQELVFEKQHRILLERGCEKEKSGLLDRIEQMERECKPGALHRDQ